MTSPTGRVVVALEARFVEDELGNIYSALLSADFFQRYLNVFESVLVVSRVSHQSWAPAGWHIVSGPRIMFHPIPNYVGPAQFLMKLPALRRAVRNLVRDDDAVILRVPSQVSSLIEPQVSRSGHPFAVEVVGDPHDVFSAGAVRHPLRRVFQWYFVRQMRGQCRRAVAFGYVTEHALQRRYPPSPGSLVTHYSSVEMAPSAYIADASDIEHASKATEVGRRALEEPCRPPRLIFVGSLARLYKAPDILLRAVAACRDAGVDVELDLVGGGRYRVELERLSVKLNITNRVRFHGEVPSGEPIRRMLDFADVFVLPSRQEGLPRAMIEAMARGLPCIGSTVGGIPELLDAEDMIPPGDVSALARKIIEVSRDPQRQARMSVRNLKRSLAYRSDALRGRREELYLGLNRATAKFAERRLS